MSSDQRALLFTHAEISHVHQIDASFIRSVLRDRFNDAVDQPRRRVCANHGYRDAVGFSDFCDRLNRKGDPCRVVDAIVVCLPEQP